MADFQIFDEFYQLELLDQQARVFLSYERQGVNLPLGHTRTYGKGRVGYRR